MDIDAISAGEGAVHNRKCLTIDSPLPRGLKIGKLLEAVYELIKEKPGSSDNPAFRDIATLRDKVERLKCEAATARIDQLRRDLELLKISDKAAFETRIAALRSLLPAADSPTQIQSP